MKVFPLCSGPGWKVLMKTVKTQVVNESWKLLKEIIIGDFRREVLEQRLRLLSVMHVNTHLKARISLT